MKMSPREKLLALVVAVLAVVVAGFVTTLGVLTAFQSRQDQIEGLQSQIHRRDLIIHNGQRAAERIAQYEARSLPPDLGEARSAYQQWLYAMTEQQFGKDTTIVGPSESSNRDIYHQFSYTISGTGNLERLTAFLYRFYSVKALHRIRSMNIQPIEDSKDLRLTFVIEALSLPTADPQHAFRPNPEDPAQVDDEKLAAYREVILGRNLFASANRQPRLASISGQSATTNRAFAMTVNAHDDDKLDKLTFALGEDAPAGARIDRLSDRSARISWTPPKAGTYRLTVTVRDDGMPPKTDSKTIEVRVSDPVPVARGTPADTRPKFDVARFTVLIAVLRGRDGRPVIWLDEKPTGRKHTLHEGDQFEVGSVYGVIRQIRVTDVIFEVDGRPMRLSKGESLTQAQPLNAKGPEIPPLAAAKK